MSVSSRVSCPCEDCVPGSVLSLVCARGGVSRGLTRTTDAPYHPYLLQRLGQRRSHPAWTRCTTTGESTSDNFPSPFLRRTSLDSLLLWGENVFLLLWHVLQRGGAYTWRTTDGVISLLLVLMVVTRRLWCCYLSVGFVFQVLDVCVCVKLLWYGVL